MKKMLITGTGSGLGRSTAIGLARAGHQVIATTQIWPQVTELRARVDELALGARIVVDKLNVLDPDDMIERKVSVIGCDMGCIETCGRPASRPSSRSGSGPGPCRPPIKRHDARLCGHQRSSST